MREISQNPRKKASFLHVLDFLAAQFYGFPKVDWFCKSAKRWTTLLKRIEVEDQRNDSEYSYSS